MKRVVAFLVLGVTLLACFERTPPSARLWFEEGSEVLPVEAAIKLGGPLRPDEVETVRKISFEELASAFSGLNLRITEERKSFWRVSVVETLSRPGALPDSGQSVHLGVLGGTGYVAFGVLSMNAIRHAPAGASRQEIIHGIGKGIGRAAVHEFVHQILGPGLPEDRADRDSYEYFSADRPSQYGELHWAAAHPLLKQKLGGG